MTPSAAETLLRGASLRVTRPRVAVLMAVDEHAHADTDSIIQAVRDDVGEVSHQAVYDVLRALTGSGLIRRIEPAGLVARYEVRVGDNHHHVVCRTCSRIADVDCAVGEVPCLTASDDSGFLIDEAEVIFWGLCAECQSQARAADESSDRVEWRGNATAGQSGAESSEKVSIPARVSAETGSKRISFESPDSVFNPTYDVSPDGVPPQDVSGQESTAIEGKRHV